MRELDVENGGHTAAADLVLLYASTQTWFASERDYKVRCAFCFVRAEMGHEPDHDIILQRIKFLPIKAALAMSTTCRTLVYLHQLS